jgi:YidC/Oxa1 family membrane protein insertase
MERNAIVATVLVIMILLGYQWYMAHIEAPVQEPPRTVAAPSEPQKSTQAPAIQPAAPSAKVAQRPKPYTPTASLGLAARDVTVDTPLMHVVLSSSGGRVTSWQLKAYRVDSGAPVDLVPHQVGADTPGPLAAWADADHVEGVYEIDRDRLDLAQPGATGSLTFKHISGTGLLLMKRLTFNADRYDVDVDVSVQNLSDGDVVVQPSLAWGPGLRNSKDKKATTIQPPTLWVDGKRVQEDLTKINGGKAVSGKISWAALQDTYFVAALLPEREGLAAFVQKAKEDQPIVGLSETKKTLLPGESLGLKAKAFAGPRDLDILRAEGQDLDKIIDLGWFDFVARPALWLLKLLFHFTGNYGIAIILVTILQKVAFYPLTNKSMKSMQAMQAIQPKVQALQERYKNNPQKKQEETMALYKKHGVNPMGGCLPMVIQIPIFIALYNALSNSVELWQAHFLWIRDLTQPDSLFKMALWGPEPINVGNLLGLLMGVSMWLQQKMSPTAGDPRQAQMMLWMMPILFTFMFWSFPSGLVLYWFVNNLLQIGQQWLINRAPAHPPAAEGQAA